MKYDSIIVGGGIAGLTSAAFLCKAGYNVLLCEKEHKLGGLVGSFDYNGFTFDIGIRALENSGILYPMLNNLDIDIDFLPNQVSIGIEQDMVHIDSKDSLGEYEQMLLRQFPEEEKSISSLLVTMNKIMDYMDILYGIDNPLFMDLNDPKYLLKTLLPWSIKYLSRVGKIKLYNLPTDSYMKTITEDQVLIDTIGQHFFKDTPAFFALSYFSLYLDYKYPKGGTGTLVSKMTDYIKAHGGEILMDTKITAIHPMNKTIMDNDENLFEYKELIWAADLKTLYQQLQGLDELPEPVYQKIVERKTFLLDKTGGDSVLSLYLTVDLDKSYFENISGPHLFYTPIKAGLSHVPIGNIKNADGSNSDRQELIINWLREFFKVTTYEISIPVMRDENLAPQGKTGLIISTLMDHSLVQHIEEMGWYENFKTLCQESMVSTLVHSIYPDLEAKILDGFVSTPLTIEKRTGNADGAITGWAFTNDIMPAISSMPKIAKSIETPIPHIVQAGQWAYSPSGLPISILTGKLAADHVAKKAKK